MRLPDGSVNMPKLAQRRMSIRTVLAPQGEAAVTLSLPARVVPDPNASGRVQASHGGRIEAGPNGLPVAGQIVRQGDVLAWVRHHADPYAQANQQAQLAELRSSKTVAEQRMHRLESLQGTVPRKDIEAAGLEAASLAVREQSIAASLNSREPLRAPVTGVVARADLQVGQMIETRDVLIDIINPSRLMVEAVTPDITLADRIGQAHVQGITGMKLHLVGGARVLRDGVLPLSFRASSESVGQPVPLAIGQPITLLVGLKEHTPGIVLPTQAVVRNPANETVVWIKVGAERFMAQPVRVQALDTQTVLVVQGLAPDNRVVVQGAALIAQIR
jgi:hypothetical protein